MCATLRLAAFAGVGSLIGLPSLVLAHHGGQIEFQNVAEGPVAGIATEFAFSFPHVVIYIDVENGSEDVEGWALNTRWTPTILRQHGWTRNSVKPGDRVTVTYNRHITNPTVVNMLTIEVNGEELPLEF